jgi:uncharacterized membrane protein YbhN (UPF0104 family)
MAHERQSGPAIALPAIALSLTVVMLAWTFRDTDAGRVGALLRRLGGAGLLILLPQLLALLVESAGWRLAFAGAGHKLPLFGLLRTRLATEALAQTLPMGVVFCESLKPMLLARTCHADLATSLSGMAARKWLLVATQAVYVASFGLLAFPVLSGISRAVVGSAALPYGLLGAAAFLVISAALLFTLLSRGRLAERAYGALCVVPWLRKRLELQRAALTQTDCQLQRFFGSAATAALPLPAFLCGWLLEAAETALILHLLGVHLPWSTVGALEVSASFVRNVVWVIPAGLGVQDLSYLAFLRALGVPDALNVAAAFLVLKRAKECFWAIVGYALLAFELRPLPVLRLAQSRG